MAVELVAGAVVAAGGLQVGVAGEVLDVAQPDAGVEGEGRRPSAAGWSVILGEGDALMVEGMAIDSSRRARTSRSAKTIRPRRVPQTNPARTVFARTTAGALAKVRCVSILWLVEAGATDHSREGSVAPAARQGARDEILAPL